LSVATKTTETPPSSPRPANESPSIKTNTRPFRSAAPRWGKGRSPRETGFPYHHHLPGLARGTAAFPEKTRPADIKKNGPTASATSRIQFSHGAQPFSRGRLAVRGPAPRHRVLGEKILAWDQAAKRPPLHVRDPARRPTAGGNCSATNCRPLARWGKTITDTH